MPTPAKTRSPPALLAALAASAVLSLNACDRNDAEAPMPRAENFPVAPNTPGDTSVPSASSVLPSEVASAPSSPPATQSNTPLNDKQESVAMPLGGQANDHSAPKAVDAAASRASAP